MSSNDNNNKLIWPRALYARWMRWCELADPYEIAAIGKCRIVGGGIEVTALALYDQTVGPASVSWDGAPIATAWHGLRDAPGDALFHVHSHVRMTAFWSGTDLKMHDDVRESAGGHWAVCAVTNLDGAIKADVVLSTPVAALSPLTPVVVDAVGGEADADFARYVKAGPVTRRMDPGGPDQLALADAMLGFAGLPDDDDLSREEEDTLATVWDDAYDQALAAGETDAMALRAANAAFDETRKRLRETASRGRRTVLDKVSHGTRRKGTQKGTRRKGTRKGVR